MKPKFLLKTMLLLCAIVGGVSSAWGQTETVLTLDCATPAPTGSTSTQLTAASDVATFLNSAAGLSSPGNLITCSSKTGDVYKGKGSGGGDIPQQCLKVGKASGGGGFTFTIPNTYDNIDEIELTCYGWKTTSSISINSGTAQTFSTAQVETKKTFDLVDPTKTITISVSTSAVCITEIVLKKKSSSGDPSTPSISADDVDIAYNATNGTIDYEISNYEDGSIEASTTADWISNFTYEMAYEIGEVSFETTANTSFSSRSATVTLTFTYDTDKTTTKNVTVTQAGDPDAVDHISDISAVSTAYTVKGTVVATNARGFVIGDGTGYVYTYLGSSPSNSVNDIVKISGTTGTYGHVLQFTNSATITSESTSSYDETPAVATIDASAISAYNADYQLSHYVQFEGTLAKSGDNYNITDDYDTTVRISYPNSSQTTALDALIDNKVIVKGYFAGFSSSTFTIMLESVERVLEPFIEVTPAIAETFTYVYGNGPSSSQSFTVTGTDLSEGISVSVDTSADKFEISSDDSNWSSSFTLPAAGGTVYARMKAGLARANYNYEGAFGLTSTGASGVGVLLWGSVTGQLYEISVDNDITGGSISANLESAEEGTTITLTATPDAAYTLGSWSVYKHGDHSTTVTVENNQFTMPAYAVDVTATFTAKPTYAVTCVASPVAGGTISASPSSAYEDQSVTITCEPVSGYTLSAITITKTSDGSDAGISVSNNTFTMPDYPVTVTATFFTNNYEGVFSLYSGALTEGDYVIYYRDYAMKNTVSSNRLANQNITPSNNSITNPDRAIVWHIAPSGDYWTIYNAKEAKYAAATGSKNQAQMLESGTDDKSLWTVTGTSTYEFENKARAAANSDPNNKWLRNNGNSGWACYASGTGGALTLYRYVTPTIPVWSELPTPTVFVGGNYNISLSSYVTGIPSPTISITSSSYSGDVVNPELYSLSNGAFSFQPDDEGEYSFTFTATNSASSVNATLTITVVEPIPTITVDPTSVEIATAASNGSLGITYTDMNTEAGVSIVWYTDAEGTSITTKPDWIEADFASENIESIEYSVSQNTSDEARSAYMKVRGEDANSVYVYSEMISFTQEGVPSLILDKKYVVNDWSDFSGSYITSATDKTINGVTFNVNQVCKQIDLQMKASVGEMTSMLIKSAKGYSVTVVTGSGSNSTGVLTVQIGSETAQTVTGASKTLTVTTESTSANFSVKNLNDGAMRIESITITPTVDNPSVSSFGWATYITDYPTTFNEGDAYVVTDVNLSEGSMTVIGVTTVPTATPVLLKGAGEKKITVAVSAEDVTNMLSVSDGVIPSGKDAWVLAKNGDGACFKKWTGDAVALNGRVALLLDSSVPAGVRMLQFNIDDVTTGISSPNHETATYNYYYNLNGQRVSKPGKGMYIKDGKIIMVK